MHAAHARRGSHCSSPPAADRCGWRAALLLGSWQCRLPAAQLAQWPPAALPLPACMKLKRSSPTRLAKSSLAPSLLPSRCASSASGSRLTPSCGQGRGGKGAGGGGTQVGPAAAHPPQSCPRLPALSSLPRPTRLTCAKPGGGGTARGAAGSGQLSGSTSEGCAALTQPRYAQSAPPMDTYRARPMSGGSVPGAVRNSAACNQVGGRRAGWAGRAARQVGERQRRWLLHASLAASQRTSFSSCQSGHTAAVVSNTCVQRRERSEPQ